MSCHGELAFFGGSMSGGEILVILVVCLLLFGSKNLPSIARNIGKSLESFRKASRDVTDEIMKADIKNEPPPARLQKDAAITSPDVESVDETPPQVKTSAHAVTRDEKPQ